LEVGGLKIRQLDGVTAITTPLIFAPVLKPPTVLGVARAWPPESASIGIRLMTLSSTAENPANAAE
jgi:hypothetical protein